MEVDTKFHEEQSQQNKEIHAVYACNKVHGPRNGRHKKEPEPPRHTHYPQLLGVYSSMSGVTIAARYGVDNKTGIELWNSSLNVYHSEIGSPLRLPRRSNLHCRLLARASPRHWTIAVQPQWVIPYLVLVGNVAQNTGNKAHVDERDHGMARGPAPVLVTVGIEFCGSVSQSSIVDMSYRRVLGCGAEFKRAGPSISYMYLCQRNVRGSSGIVEGGWV